MGVNHFLIQSVFGCVVFQLLRNPSCSDTLTKAIKKKIAGGTIDFAKPFCGFLAQGLRNINTTYFATFGVDVKITHLHVFSLRLD